MRVNLRYALLCAALLACPVADSQGQLKSGAPPPAQADSPILGFLGESGAAQRAIEVRFDASLSGQNIGARLRLMSSAPNHVGAPHNKANAEFTLQQFRSWGWDARMETFDVLYPTPKRVSVELVSPVRFSATLTEPPVAGDASSARTEGVLPAYLTYSADGDVTAPLVYVNYGMAEDYETLASMGISVKGKIVIARYGAGWRGLKPKLAYEHGAVGCIIYSDPAEDGYGVGDVYPKGAWRPAGSVQRGSVMDLIVQPGDPLTPGVAATKSAQRLPIDQAAVIMKIPVLPISYGDAVHFLAALDGPAVPKAWRGALPITYHVGPGPAEVRLAVESDWSLKTIYNAIAEMKGSEWPDQWIIRGNNRDALVFGAFVALSGHVAMMEEAKAIGALARSGWKPRRTIVYASWDGESAALLGSTEWTELHANELQAKGALYINTGIYGRGFLETLGSYSTMRLIDQVAADVIDPQTHVSVRERALAAHQVQAFAAGASGNEIERSAAALPVGDLGAGSDYSPFVQNLGIASINLEFGGEDEQFGIYQSIYDTYEHFERFGDPDLTYGVALASTAGRLVLRSANADILPFAFGGLADRIGGQVQELRQLADSIGERARTQNALLDRRVFALAADPIQSAPLPARESAPPVIDFGPLDAAVARLKASARGYDAALARTVQLTPEKQRSVNATLLTFEQCTLHPDGLPGRPWYRNLLYAPGLTTGYAAKTLPGVREAIEGRRWSEAGAYVVWTARALQNCSDRLDYAINMLTP